MVSIGKLQAAIGKDVTGLSWTSSIGQQRRCVRRTSVSNAKQQEFDWESMPPKALLGNQNPEVVKEFGYLWDSRYFGQRRMRCRAGELCILWTSPTAEIQKTSKPYVMWDIPHIDIPGGPLRTHVLDHPSGGCKLSGRVWATHLPDHLWRCVWVSSMEKKDELRACWAVRWTEHPD